MFFNSFQTLNTNFWGGFNAFAFPQFSFMPTPWNFSCFTPSFNFNNNWGTWNNLNNWSNWSNWNFNNYNQNIWDTPGKIHSQSFTPTTNTDSFVKTSAPINHTDDNNNDDNNNDKLKDYNSFAGHRLAEIAMQGRQFNSWSSVPKGQGMCAHYVTKALATAGMANGMKGHAYQMINILQNNRHFKQIPANNIDTNELPAGCILVYKRGSQGYSEDYGHVEIMTEDGKGVSQAITNHVKEPDAIFIPV